MRPQLNGATLGGPDAMQLSVTDQGGVLVAYVNVHPDCPFAREPGEPPGFVFGTFTRGPGFADVQTRLHTFNQVYATGNVAEAASLHEDIDRLNLIATDENGLSYRVFNVYFEQGGNLFAAVR